MQYLGYIIGAALAAGVITLGVNFLKGLDRQMHEDLIEAKATQKLVNVATARYPRLSTLDAADL